MKRALIISANLGSYDPVEDWVQQQNTHAVSFEVQRLNDYHVPPRPLAMTSRLMAGMPKMFGWDMFPGWDIYIWADASRTITSADFGKYMVDQLGTSEFAVFLHPHRHSIQEEYEFVQAKLNAGDKYLSSRYAHEYLGAQWEAIRADAKFKDKVLYASTGFAYHPTPAVKKAMTEWWLHKTRYLLHDQLALPYVLWKHRVKVAPIAADIYKFPYWEYTRKRK